MKTLITKQPVRAYFALAFGITWTIFSPIVFGENGFGWLPYLLPDGLVLLLFISSTFGPLAAALIVTKMNGGQMRALLRRGFQWRVGIIWYIVAIFAPLTVWLIAYSLVLDGAPLVLLVNNVGFALSAFFGQLLFGIIIPSWGEEPGWRGFALPELQKRHHPIVATVLLGTLHGLWHLPALSVPALLGPLTLENVLTFVLTSVAATFLYVWVYNHSQTSLLPVILLHSASNAASNLLGNLFSQHHILLDTLPISYRWLNVIAFGVLALLLMIATRGNLGYRLRDDAHNH